MPPTYDPLPRTSSSFDLLRPNSPSNEFKDKPLPNRRCSLLRRARRCSSRICRPQWIALLLATCLLWQLAFNGSYLLSHAPPYTVHASERVFIAANIIDGDLVSGAWGRSLLELVERIGSERVFVSIYGGPAAALRQLESMLECETRIVSEEEEPLDMSRIPRTLLPSGERKVKRIAYLAEVRNKVLEPLYKAGKGRQKWDKVLFINDVFFDAEGATRLLWGTRIDKEGGSAYKAVCAADFVTSWKYYDTFATRDVEGYSIGVPLFPWFSAEGEAVTRNDVLAGKDAVRVKSCWGGMVAFQGEYFWARDEGGANVENARSVSANLHPDAQIPELLDSRSQSGKDVKALTANNGIGIPQLPLRFRSEPEPFWDSSECCLIHADIISLGGTPDPKTSDDKWDTGIYMNPYVRTSYSESTFRYLEFAKRWERLSSPLQRMLNYFANMPRWNYRRTETEGEVMTDNLWISIHSNMSEMAAVYVAEHDFASEATPEAGLEERATLGKVRGKEYWENQGYYVDYRRVAKRGGYCGVRQLLVMKEGKLEPGEGNWDNLLDRVPPVDV
ncbi:hypothetical protein LZ554_007726 [Drepanopeziza brunnea f. sp. 'monogermtubi']|nr:hypothetical protein LZ554_007726 [Drepanopeziza brunnea f. sp. 'monogermtubi']